MTSRINGLAFVCTFAWPLAATIVAASSFAADPAEPLRQDGRFMRKLRWVSPHGELPGTYAEYLQRRPLRPARFGNQSIATPAGGAVGARGRAASAVPALERAVAIDPGHAKSHRLLGMCYLQAGRTEEALRAMRTFLDLAPEDPEAETTRALVEYLEAQASGS